MNVGPGVVVGESVALCGENEVFCLAVREVGRPALKRLQCRGVKWNSSALASVGLALPNREAFVQEVDLPCCRSLKTDQLDAALLTEN
jgi:hypothetical protein